MKKFQATLIKNQITSNSAEAQTLHQKSRFGHKEKNKISYSPAESLFLVEKNNLEILNFQNKILSEKDLTKKFSNLDKNFLTKYAVFKNLRENGLIPKTALKFGSDFRIYENTTSKHSKWLCHCTSQNKKISMQDFTAKNRLSNSSKKLLLIAIVDEENCVSYFETNWLKI